MIPQSRGIRYAVFCAACALIIGSIIFGARALALLRHSGPVVTDGRKSLLVREMGAIDIALKSSADVQFYQFSGNFESPFRLQGTSRQRDPDAQRKAEKPPRATLVFKGILMKDKPVAIIEDETGKTFICRVGDIVGEQKVISIASDNIKLSDSRGTYTLSAPRE
jgi:hypothetical protein